jgi:hypothetical protein
MKILTQDKATIAEVGNEVWIVSWGEKRVYAVMHKGYIQPQLGVYGSQDRALEVMAEIFNGIDNGKAAYAMPEK